MRAIAITPKNHSEFLFISDLLKKLRIEKRVMSLEDMEDTGLSEMMRDVDRTKKVSRERIMKKLSD